MVLFFFLNPLIIKIDEWGKMMNEARENISEFKKFF